MAKLKNFPFLLSGKIGDMVACSGRTIKPYVRKLPQFKAEPTEAQLKSRLKFRMASKFLQAFASLVDECWTRPSYRRLSPRTQAFGGIIYYITGDYPDLRIDYSMIQLSSGTSPLVANCKMVIESDLLRVTWEDPHDLLQFEDDVVIVALYDERLKASLILWGPFCRRDEKAEWVIPETFAKEGAHAWLILRSVRKRNASSTMYLGSFINQSRGGSADE